MKRRILLIMAAFFVVTLIAPTTLRAGDAFWYGVNIEDAGMDPADMEAIHDAIVTGIIGLVPTPTGFPTGDPVDDAHRGLRIWEKDKTWDGYTLLNAFWPTGTDANGNNVLIDMDGNIVNEWTFPGMGYLSASKMLPGGHIVGSSVEGMMAPGGKLTQMDWYGETVRQWDTVMHHDHEREGSPCGYYAPYKEPKTFDGKVLVLEAGFPPEELTGHICSSKPIMDDTIRELSWDGEELFRWEFWLHFDELELDEWAEAAIDLGINYQGPDWMAPFLPEDWSHGNAVAWVGKNKWWDKYRDARFHPNNIIADFRSLNITIIIARHPHPDGDWEEGEIVWQLGPDYSTDGDDYKVGQIIGQHQAHIIPKGLPGEGNMLIFDNGGAAGYGALVRGLRDSNGNPLAQWPNTFRMNSRVLEINPVTKQIVWEYKQPMLSEDLDGDGKILGNEKLFFSNLMSGMQRLPNGNTLICEADVGRIFEVTRSGEVVWEYAPTWVIETPPFPFFKAVYRAYRIPYWWVPKEFVDGQKYNRKKK
jgi:hypothetical protein